MSESVEPSRPTRWRWVIAIVALGVIGVLLAIADIALNAPWLGPVSDIVVGPPVTFGAVKERLPGSDRFERTKPVQTFTFVSPFKPRAPISPLQGLRALLSNGAALIFIALAVLVVFPNQARIAVQRLESSGGPIIAVVAGVVTALLVIAALLLLRFTLIFLVLVPVLAAVVLAIALFGIACVTLAIGRLMQTRLRFGSVHPLIAALAGALVVFDLVLIPYAGIVALAVVTFAGLGIVTLTRFGSASGWSFRDLNW
ncbi:MAG TPA: hypothetical protein VGV88_01915 [Candidatus Dormibacteraeota bacterium]|nr:hypothetical protein [Candidatus Dormibacteraeota bacterium]